MRENKSIPKLLESTITDSDLQDTSAALAEFALDSLLESGTLKDIPLLGSVLGLGRVACSIRDRLFIKKLCFLLTQLEAVPLIERKRMIQKINESEESENHIGEKLLYIVDRCEDQRTATKIGRLFRLFLEESISYDEFLTYSSIVNILTHSDLEEFTQSKWEELDAEDTGHYQSQGLMVLSPPSVSVSDQDDWKKAGQPYVVKSHPLLAVITERGKTLRKLLE